MGKFSQLITRWGLGGFIFLRNLFPFKTHKWNFGKLNAEFNSQHDPKKGILCPFIFPIMGKFPI